MSSNHPLGPYLIGERVGSSVWLAEDTRSGKKIALKLLTRTLPKDPGKRETLIRDARVSAALYHTFLVPIVEIAPIGDNLVMIMEIVEGKPLAAPLGRDDFFRFAWQLASVLKYLHTKSLLHANLNADAVMVTNDGQVRLGGLNLTNLVRRDRSSSAYQQKGSDPRCVAYMAPEQIVSQPISEHTVIFSLGAVLYEAATGRAPFAGETAPDIARAIVEAQPTSPRSLNPQIDKDVMSVLGACLFKDPFKRAKDLKALVETIERVAPEAPQFAAQFEKKATAAQPHVEQRKSILLVADVADYDEIAARDPEAAAKAVARMQQVLGEAVYLFDGKVIDPFGKRLVAELPSVDSALEAGRKGEFDVQPDTRTGTPVNVRLLLHAGAVEMKDGEPTGAAMAKAAGVLEQLPANALYITEDFVKEGRGAVRLRDAGARAGVKLFTIVPVEPPPTEVELSTAELEAEEAAEQAVLLEAQSRGNRKRFVLALATAAVLLVIFGGVVAMWKRRTPAVAPVDPVAAMPTGPQPATAANPRRVILAPFTVEDPAL
ncbi:MAG TPA: serine/threonine-protein kinase, partial [Vicinamibacterales bacterium]|nr:serine/threonine-protein kinase [Vicinamibacterales bacterium]